MIIINVIDTFTSEDEWISAGKDIFNSEDKEKNSVCFSILLSTI